MAKQIGGRKARTFLQALADGLTVCAAAEKAGAHRGTIYRWRSESTDFAMAWDESENIGTDVLEAEAIRRATEGTQRPVYQGGELVGYVREYSDNLLMFMLKARRPEKFRENVEIRGSVSVNHKLEPMELEAAILSKLAILGMSPIIDQPPSPALLSGPTE